MITTIEEAKTFACNVTSGKLSPDQAQERLEFYKKYKQNAFGEEEKEDWQHRIDELDSWINSEQFRNGDFPQGIDTLVLDL